MKKEGREGEDSHGYPNGGEREEFGWKRGTEGKREEKGRCPKMGSHEEKGEQSAWRPNKRKMKQKLRRKKGMNGCRGKEK